MCLEGSLVMTALFIIAVNKSTICPERLSRDKTASSALSSSLHALVISLVKSDNRNITIRVIKHRVIYLVMNEGCKIAGL